MKYTQDSLKSMTLPVLKGICKEKGIKRYSKLPKTLIIDMILNCVKEETTQQETMQQETIEILDFEKTSIAEYKEYAIKKDNSLSHILNKCYGFFNNKTDFVKLICQLLGVDEKDYIPTKTNETIELEMTDYDINKFKMFDNIYQRFTDFINYLCINNKSYDYPKFASLIDDTAIDLYNFTKNNSKDNMVNPFSLSNHLSQLKTYLIPNLLKDNKSFPDNILISNFIDLFNAIKDRKEIKDNLIEKRNITNAHINQRQSNMLNIECNNLIVWTEQTLNKLQDVKMWNKEDKKAKAMWTDIAIALMVSTGRRSSEIMSSGKFTQIDYYHVNFIGQLKGNCYETTPIKIPVLVNSELVILGLDWLDFMGKREKSDFTIDDDNTIKNKAKKAHQRFSRYLNEDVKKIFSDTVVIKNDDGISLNYDDGKVKNRATCHLLRQIYSQIAYQIFYYNKEISKKKHYILAEILGHEQNEQNAIKASQNYDSDFEIRDYDIIQKTIGY